MSGNFSKDEQGWKSFNIVHIFKQSVQLLIIVKCLQFS
ncbi:MAG: hypothetical protein OFPI_32820 [Osedax symbiont Rs2]|nr:MAG: hypothetical protein OFPI_32820 [Osedax symbiont Rs2]